MKKLLFAVLLFSSTSANAYLKHYSGMGIATDAKDASIACQTAKMKTFTQVSCESQDENAVPIHKELGSCDCGPVKQSSKLVMQRCSVPVLWDCEARQPASIAQKKKK